MSSTNLLLLNQNQMKKIPPSSDRLLKTVLTNWMAESALLLQNYHKLTNVVNSYCQELPPSLGFTQGSGQCPWRELLMLLDLFEGELKALLLDIDKSTNQGPPTALESRKKLAAHTLRLHHLNRQAQLRLQLAGLPAS